ncbi:MAG TPA: hypothetical protein VGD37_31205 [Kofleriaceae bacterium]|jgi:hypothetical protein
MQRLLFAVAASLSLGALACVPEQTLRPAAYGSGPPGLQIPQTAPSDDQQVCQDVQPTGSHIAHTECRSEADAAIEHTAAQDWAQRNPATPPYQESSDPFKRIHE